MYKKIEKKFKYIADTLDRKLKNGTVMVVIISSMITASGFVSANVTSNLTANVLQAQKNTIKIEQYINIDGKKYKIILEEVK